MSRRFIISCLVFTFIWSAVCVLAMKWALACDKGCSEYQGTCACDAAPEKAVQTDMPSDEKPPHLKTPPWEREGVHVDMPPIAKDTAPPPDDLGKTIENGGVPQR